MTDHLQSDRLNLRPIRFLDTPFVTTLITNQKVRRFLGGPVPFHRCPGVIRSYMRRAPDYAAWVVSTRALNREIGLMFLDKHKEEDAFALSYQFFPTSWGQGYGLEAASAVRDYAFDVLKHDCLVAETQVANAPSCKLLEKLGMIKNREVVRFGATQAIYKTSAPNNTST